MINSWESKQDQSRHFGFKHQARKARDSTTFTVNEAKRASSKTQVKISSRHISRKDLFYGGQSARKAPSPNLVKKVSTVLKKKKVSYWTPNKSFDLDIYKARQAMHPDQVQISGRAESLMEEKNPKHHEVVEEEINVLDVDNGDFNVVAKDELNGNGFFHKENGHPRPQEKEKVEENLEGKADANALNGSEVKSVLRLKGSRRNSTSSRSSSVSSAPSMKQQTPMALRMEVSVDEDDRDHLEPLIMEGTAEDLEVSMSASHDDDDDDDGDEGATTDSEAVMEAVMEIANDPYEFLEDTGSENAYDSEVIKKAKSPRSGKGIKPLKSPVKTKAEVKAVKSKTPRTKSLTLKGSKTSPKASDDVDTENSDTNSLYKDDTESEELNVKPHKSPKRSKPISSKQDNTDEVEAEGKGHDAEHAPRRSSRSRQTPQKYNSSMYVDSYWDNHPASEDRMNNSDAVFGASIRSVKGRRSLRKSRNISSLNSSLHNESSPWDSDMKVLTPAVGGVSAHIDTPADENVDSCTPLKRKAMDEDEDEDDVNGRGQKKMCIENTDLNVSTASQTSSFFSVITSPIVRLKNKLRGSSVSSSTPIKESDTSPTIELVVTPEKENDGDAEATETVALPGEDVAPEARSWCLIM